MRKDPLLLGNVPFQAFVAPLARIRVMSGNRTSLMGCRTILKGFGKVSDMCSRSWRWDRIQNESFEKSASLMVKLSW